MRISTRWAFRRALMGLLLVTSLAPTSSSQDISLSSEGARHGAAIAPGLDKAAEPPVPSDDPLSPFRSEDEPTLPPVVVTPNDPTQATSPSEPLRDISPLSGVRGDGVTSDLTTPYAASTKEPTIDRWQAHEFPRRTVEENERLGGQVFAGVGADAWGLNSAARGPVSVLDVPGLATVIDRDLLSRRLSSDMARALQNEVGVLVQQTARGQASPFLRGLTGEQVLILVDGVRVNNTTFRGGPNQYFNTVDPGQVDHIEVVRGAQSVLWGSDAIGGAINIVTRGADPNRGEYRGGSFIQNFTTADSASYSRANVEGWMASQGVFAGGSYLNVRDVDRGGGLGRQPFTNYDQYAGDVKYNLMLDENQLLTLSFSHFVQRDLPRSDRFAPFVFGPPVNQPRPTFFNPQQRDMATIRWQGQTDENLLYDAFSFTASYALTREGTVEIRSATQREDGLFRDDMTGFQWAFGRELGDWGRWTYGADYYYEDVDASRFRVNPANPQQAPSTRTPQFPNDTIADRAGAFAYWDVPITDRLQVNAGVRYENANVQATPEFTINNATQNIFFERSYQDWIASIGGNYTLTETLHVVGGVYEGYRSPTADDLTANKTFLQNAQSNPSLGSLDVQPDHSWTYEIGFKHDSDRWQLQVIQWWTEFDQYIARSVDRAGNVFLGNHEASLYGTDMAISYVLERGWSTYGNFAYAYGRDDTLSEPFSRIPPAQGVVGLRWQDDRRRQYVDIYTWLVGRQDRYSSLNFTDSRFPVGGNPGYGTLNLRCGTKFGPHDNQRLNLSLENITDKYYRVLGSGVDGAGFNAGIGYELNF